MNKTFYLFSKPSFINGMARSIDLFGTFTDYNISGSGLQADIKALNNDAKQIGKDFYTSFSFLGSNFKAK